MIGYVVGGELLTLLAFTVALIAFADRDEWM
jgi:hypothetical protein